MGVGRAVSAGAGHQVLGTDPVAPRAQPLGARRPVPDATQAGSSVGSPWGLRVQGAGSEPPGPRDRFVYKHSRGPAAASGGSKGAVGPRVQGGNLLGESGKCGVRDLAEGTSGRCFFLSIVPAGLDSGGQGGGCGSFLSLVTLGVCWTHWVRVRRPRGPPPAGDWLLSKLPGVLGRPWAEVTAAEFLPGRFPAPPQCPCQGGGHEFSPARRNVGASPASTSR